MPQYISCWPFHPLLISVTMVRFSYFLTHFYVLFLMNKCLCRFRVLHLFVHRVVFLLFYIFIPSGHFLLCSCVELCVGLLVSFFFFVDFLSPSKVLSITMNLGQINSLRELFGIINNVMFSYDVYTLRVIVDMTLIL